jgi:hypothetical protein
MQFCLVHCFIIQLLIFLFLRQMNMWVSCIHLLLTVVNCSRWKLSWCTFYLFVFAESEPDGIISALAGWIVFGVIAKNVKLDYLIYRVRKQWYWICTGNYVYVQLNLSLYYDTLCTLQYLKVKVTSLLAIGGRKPHLCAFSYLFLFF